MNKSSRPLAFLLAGLAATALLVLSACSASLGDAPDQPVTFAGTPVATLSPPLAATSGYSVVAAQQTADAARAVIAEATAAQVIQVATAQAALATAAAYQTQQAAQAAATAQQATAIAQATAQQATAYAEATGTTLAQRATGTVIADQATATAAVMHATGTALANEQRVAATQTQVALEAALTNATATAIAALRVQESENQTHLVKTWGPYVLALTALLVLVALAVVVIGIVDIRGRSFDENGLSWQTLRAPGRAGEVVVVPSRMTAPVQVIDAEARSADVPVRAQVQLALASEMTRAIRALLQAPAGASPRLTSQIAAIAQMGNVREEGLPPLERSEDPGGVARIEEMIRLAEARRAGPQQLTAGEGAGDTGDIVDGTYT